MWPTTEAKNIFLYEDIFTLILIPDFSENKFSCIYLQLEYIAQLICKGSMRQQTKQRILRFVKAFD